MNTDTSNQLINNKHLRLIEDLVLVFLLLFSTKFLNPYWHIKLLIITVLIVAHFSKLRFKYQVAFWGLTLSLLVLEFIAYYFWLANHVFVLFYFTFSIFLSHLYPLNRIKIIQINTLAILLLIMFWSAVQKLISPEFMNGDFITYLSLRGDLFQPLQWIQLIPSEVFKQNATLINDSLTTLPKPDQHIKLLTPFKGFETFTYYFSLFIVLSEFLMVPVLFIKNVRIKNSIILLFLVGLLLTKFETGFLSLLIILSIAQLPPAEKTFRLIYLGLFAVCLSLIISKIGLY